jgi:hypothetical protein
MPVTRSPREEQLRRPAQPIERHPLDDFVDGMADLLAQWWVRQPESRRRRSVRDENSPAHVKSGEESSVRS